MTGQAEDNQRVIEYLLGSLPEAEKERLDELSVTDRAFADSVAAAEHDLVDAFVRGELTGQTLERFQSHYLATPLRREKERFARTLHGFADRSAVTGRAPYAALGRPLSRWILAAAVLTLAVAGGWLVYENARLRQQIGQPQAQRNEDELRQQLDDQRLAAAETERELTRTREERQRLEKELKEITIVSHVLTPQLRAVAAAPLVRIPAGASHVAMQLELESNDYGVYRVALLELGANKGLWSSDTFAARKTGQGTALDVSFRADMFEPGRYVLRVTGLPPRGAAEIVADYPFTVLRE